VTPAARSLGRLSREFARRELATLAETGGVRSTVLFTADGFEVASHAADPAAASRLAAIGSSLAALGSAISAEAGLHDFERTLVESSDGLVLIMRVGGTRAMSLAVVTDQTAVLGTVLWAAQRSCQALERISSE
jgi:uncharacterized protein